MIIGITGKAQSGKDTVCEIIKGLDVYHNNIPEKEQRDIHKFVYNFLYMRNTMWLLQTNINSRWKKHMFAGKLKECACIILNQQDGAFEYSNFKNSFTSLSLSNRDGEPMTNREFLQYLGTEVGRNIDKDLWVKSLMSEYDNNYREIAGTAYKPLWIIPDVRFPNEAQAIRDRNGIIIKLKREGAGAGNHESESYISEIIEDVEINNNDTIDELIDGVISIYDFYKLNEVI